jgi:hypothetical protein
MAVVKLLPLISFSLFCLEKTSASCSSDIFAARGKPSHPTVVQCGTAFPELQVNAALHNLAGWLRGVGGPIGNPDTNDELFERWSRQHPAGSWVQRENGPTREDLSALSIFVNAHYAARHGYRCATTRDAPLLIRVESELRITSRSQV